ncbi:MAG: DegT/DnrJ/EryC1/StrS family aminotransferase [bacterium]|nr:DegT/DnrJ/EryC1/StrS family aminotransferase [bacterium]
MSPNTERDDVFLAFRLLFQPWRWFGGKNSGQLEGEFKKYLGIEYAVSFNSGRSALMAILDAMDIKEGDEIILQAFTCNSAVNPILGRKAKPVFVDIDDTLNLDPEDLRRKISLRTKAVMVQHNFGWPAKMEEILNVTRGRNLYLIEDCAHALGAKYQGKLCGTFGDAAFFSFGRDKVISSVFGGMAVTRGDKIGERLKSFQNKLEFPSGSWIFQQLLHPVLMNWKIMPAYAIHPFLGRVILGLAHKLSILSKAVYGEEKRGKMSKHFPKLLSNAFSLLALNQLKKLERFNRHRKEIAEFYKESLIGFKMPLAGPLGEAEPIFMRFPVLVGKETDGILREARKRRMFLNDGWRKSPIVPSDTDKEKMQYISGSCPRAEKASRDILNLPTHINISKKNARIIVDFLKKYGG